MCEKPTFQKLSDIAGDKINPKPLGDDALRSTRRQRTTPSFSRSGPASTTCAN